VSRLDKLALALLIAALVVGSAAALAPTLAFPF
jgi:hypothetical protein